MFSRFNNSVAMADAVNPDFLIKIEKRQKQRQQSFEALKCAHPLDTAAQAIVQLNFQELLSKLQSRDLSATQVLNAYTAKALNVTEKTNCVTEFVPQAAKWAEELDEKAKNRDARLGPLHGVPVAVKDDLDIEGMDTTLGFAHNLDKPMKEHAVVVKVLMNQGAVPFCKTNLPQSILSFGSDNPIYGIVKNGLRPDLAPGGSSSGSGSIVAAGGAPIATGSDLGGSLRCPSHYHGLSSMRGTTNRLSEKGMIEACPVLTQRGVPGIIAPDAKTMSYLWKCLTEDNQQNELDPEAVPIPWNEHLFSSPAKLRIGYYTSLNAFIAFPDTQKTVLAAKDALLAEGHQVVPFEMPDDRKYMQAAYQHIFGGHLNTWVKDQFAGEPLSMCMRDYIEDLRSQKPPPPQENVDTAERDRMRSAAGFPDNLTGEELLNVTYQKRVLTHDILGRMESAGVDLLLAPLFPHPAVKLERGHKVMSNAAYTMTWNFVNFPAGTVRFGTETGCGISSYEDNGDPFLIEVKESLKDSAGMPINVQVIGKPFKEELVLRALVELERLREK